ncbi:MAG: radical SAM/SPASM domain-containing protein [Thermodesulfobacteriota bacterium]
MANVLLTQRCVRSCPYCFAKDHMARSLSDDILSWDDLIYLADFIETSGEQHVSLLGGEPTLHPDFVNFVLYLLERKISITVFTSGIISEVTLNEMASALKGYSEEHLHFVCNLNEPDLSPPGEGERIRPFLERFGNRTVASFNIYHLNFKLDFLFQSINQYGLSRQIRLGLAHPITNSENKFVSIHSIRRVIERLFSYTPHFQRFRISPFLDCGFPMCAFSDEQLGTLYRLRGGDIRFGCSPAFDIGPDMTVWCCFPMSSYHKKSIFEFDSIKEIIHFYQARLNTIRIEAGGIYEACDDCQYREEDKCAGGCVAHLIRDFRSEERVRLEEIYS